MSKRAETGHPIHDLIAERWSPYAFDGKPVSKSDLASLFEAARWAPSSYNEQPWRFVVASKEDAAAFELMLGCLVEGNQAWAKDAGALILGVTSKTFALNGFDNHHARHDLGLAVGNLCVEATSRGLAVHQMGGILPDVARERYGIPDAFDIVTGIAVGRAADPATLPDALRERETAARSRRALSDTVFAGRFGDAASL